MQVSTYIYPLEQLQQNIVFFVFVQPNTLCGERDNIPKHTHKKLRRLHFQRGRSIPASIGPPILYGSRIKDVPSPFTGAGLADRRLPEAAIARQTVDRWHWYLERTVLVQDE